MIIVDRISQLPNGQPVDAGTPVELRREYDGSLLDTQLTDINGWVQFEANGSPGPVYTQVTIGDESRYRYGRAVAQVGSWFEGEWQSFMDMVIPGVIQTNNPDALKVIPGTGLMVRVSPGSAMVEGILGRYYEHENISIPSNGSGNTRHDLVVMRLHVSGQQVGRVAVDLVQGVPSSSPQDPVLSPEQDVAQLVLARVRVQSGVSVIQASDIEDRRLEASFVPDGSIVTKKLANGAVTTVKLANGSVTTDKLANDSVTPAKLDRSYSLSTHSHSWGQVTGKPSSFPPSTHNHTWSQVTGKPSTFPSTWATVSGKPSTFAPSSHTHSGSQITSSSIAEDRLSASVRNKLNANGYNHSTEAPFNWINVNNETGVNVSNRSVSLAPGRWALFLLFNGQVVSNGTSTTGVQVSLRGTAAGGLVSSHAVQNVEGPPANGVGANGVSIMRVNTVTNSSSTNTTYTLTVNARRIGGNTGRISGAAELAAIRIS